MTTTRAVADHDDLSEFGYDQQLHRRLGKFASFAAGFSFVSILTTIFQLFGLGFGFGGPAFFWTWPCVFLGQFLVALCFAELAARYPISGAIYQWSRRRRRRGDRLVRRLVHDHRADRHRRRPRRSRCRWCCPRSGPDSRSSATTPPHLAQRRAERRPARLGAAGRSRRRSTASASNWMSRINTIGVTCEIVGVIAVIGVFFTHAQRGPAGRVRHRHARRPARLHLGVDHVRADGRLRDGRIRLRRRTRRGDQEPAPGRAAHHPARPVGLRARRRPDDHRRADGRAVASPTAASPPEGLPYVLDLVLSSPWGTLLLVDVAHRDLRLHPGDPDRGVPADVLHGPRRPAAGLAAAVAGEPAHRHPDLALGADRRGVHRHPARERRQLRDLRDPGQRLHHPDLPRLPDGHRSRCCSSGCRAGRAQRNLVDAEGRPLFSLGRSGSPSTSLPSSTAR